MSEALWQTEGAWTRLLCGGELWTAALADRGERGRGSSVCGQLGFSGGDIAQTQAERGDASTGQEVRAEPVFGLEVGVGFPDLSCHWLIFYSVDMFSYC